MFLGPEKRRDQRRKLRSSYCSEPKVIAENLQNGAWESAVGDKEKLCPRKEKWHIYHIASQ